jgi:hypothetical protein
MRKSREEVYAHREVTFSLFFRDYGTTPGPRSNGEPPVLWDTAMKTATSDAMVRGCTVEWVDNGKRTGEPATMSVATAVLNPYASFLKDQDPLTVLDATTSRLESLAHTIGSEKITRPPAPGKWSARDILAHLADCEIAFAFRFRQTLAEDHHMIQPFDQEKWASTYAERSASEALAAFAALRRWNLLLIRSSLPAHARKPVTHPERGAMTFSTIV